MTEAQPFIREVLDLTPLIAEVADLRRNYAEGKGLYDALFAEWQAQNDFAIRTLAAVKRDLDAAESSLRGEALANYAATGDKQVAPGIVIRVNRKPIYDVKAASAWSKLYGGIAHVFDAKTFEKLVAMGQAADIVTIEEVPIATLAKDLGAMKALGEAFPKEVEA